MIFWASHQMNELNHPYRCMRITDSPIMVNFSLASSCPSNYAYGIVPLFGAVFPSIVPYLQDTIPKLQLTRESENLSSGSVSTMEESFE